MRTDANIKPARETDLRTATLLLNWNTAMTRADASRRCLDGLRVVRFTPILASLAALIETVGGIHDRDVEDAGAAEEALARELLQSGPIEDAAWRYEGVGLGGFVTVRRTVTGTFPPEKDVPPVAAHASCAVAADDGTAY